MSSSDVVRGHQGKRVPDSEQLRPKYPTGSPEDLTKARTVLKQVQTLQEDSTQSQSGCWSAELCHV